jgi:hypothetical protein
MSGFDPRFKTRLDALLNEAQGAGHSPKIVSGYRSPFDQRRAINQVANKLYGRPASFIEMARGIPGYAAAPGASKHQHGLAADIAKGPALDWMHANASRFGIGFPIKTDTVHAQFDPRFQGTIETNPTYNDNELGPDPNIGGGVVAPGAGQPATGGTAVAGMQSRPYLSDPVSGQAPGQTLQGMTPERVAMMRAQAMRDGQAAGDTSPVGHWSAALARALGGLNSSVGMSQANAGEMQGQQAVANALMSGGDMTSTGRALAATPYGAKMGQQMLLADMQNRAKLEAQRNDPMRQAQLSQMKNQTPEYRAMIAEKYGLKPGTPEHRMFVLQGQLPSKTGPDASTMKHIFTSQDELPDLKGSIETLEEARSLLGSMYHGRGSQTRSSINQSIPGLNIISDPLKAKNTQRFYQIMNEQAINKMSDSLKGSTTNQEMMEFKEMIADPNVSPETKQKTIETMLVRARRHLQIKSQRIRDLGGQVPIDPAPQQPPPDGGAGAGWSATRVK